MPCTGAAGTIAIGGGVVVATGYRYYGAPGIFLGFGGIRHHHHWHHR